MSQLPGSARVNQYTATAGQTTFIYDFKIYDDDEITVQQNSTTLTLTTDYTVTGAGDAGGGTIVLNSGATLNDTITLTGNTMVERDTTFTNGGEFSASAINGEYNKILNLLSENVTELGKSVRLAVYDASFDAGIPTPVANKAIKINAAGDGFVMSDYDPDDAEAAATAAEAAQVAAEAAQADAETAKTDAEAAQAAAEAAAASIDLDDLGSDIIPATDSNYDLGSTSKRFAEIWGDDLTLTGTATVGGDMDVTGGITVNTDKFTVAAATGNTAIDGTLTVGGTEITAPLVAHYQKKVAYNVDGGTSTASAWTKRPIDTELYDDIGITLSSDVLTLPAGTYKVTGFSVHVNAAIIMLRLYDTTNSAVLVTGASNNVTGDNESIPIQGVFTLAGSADVELQYYCTNAIANTGLGVKSNINVGDNVYADLLFQKVA